MRDGPWESNERHQWLQCPQLTIQWPWITVGVLVEFAVVVDSRRCLFSKMPLEGTISQQTNLC